MIVEDDPNVSSTKPLYIYRVASLELDNGLPRPAKITYLISSVHYSASAPNEGWWTTQWDPLCRPTQILPGSF